VERVAQFCCKMWGGTLVRNQYSHRVDAEITIYIYRFPILFVEVFWEQHWSRFVLADDLHINVLKFCCWTRYCNSACFH